MITGQLLDEYSLPLSGLTFDAWLDSNGERVDIEGNWHITFAAGDFVVDLPPGSGGTLHILQTGTQVEMTETGSMWRQDPGAPRQTARVPIPSIPAGHVDVGQVVSPSRN